MRMRLMAFIFVAAMLLSTAFLVNPMGGSVSAHGPCDGDGSAYGTEHIAGHTPHGPPGEHHNPGTAHQGFSLCLGVHN